MDNRAMEIQSEIAGLKQILAATDYKALKHADGALSDEDYAETKVQRQELRDKINELEAELAEVTSKEDADAVFEITSAGGIFLL